MTVCIATMAGDGSIFGVSDRRLSSTSVQYSPLTTKIYHAGERPLAVMWADDSSFQSQVVQALNDVADSWVRSGRVDCTVKELVDAFVACFHVEYEKRVENEVLRRYAMTWEQLATRTDLAPDFRNQVDGAVAGFRKRDCVGVQLIVAGVDDTGPHLWETNNGESPICRDHTGFVVIGSGHEYAWPLFTRMQYARSAPPAYALWMAFAAEKLAERDPYVGPETDVVRIAIRDGHMAYRYSPDDAGRLKAIWDTELTAAEQEGDPAAYIRAARLLDIMLSGHAADSDTSNSKPMTSASDQT